MYHQIGAFGCFHIFWFCCFSGKLLILGFAVPGFVTYFAWFCFDFCFVVMCFAFCVLGFPDAWIWWVFGFVGF